MPTSAAPKEFSILAVSNRPGCRLAKGPGGEKAPGNGSRRDAHPAAALACRDSPGRFRLAVGGKVRAWIPNNGAMQAELNPSTGVVHFEERQTFWQNRALLALLVATESGTAALLISLAIVQPQNRTVMLLAAFVACILVPALILSWRMTTRIDNEQLVVRMFPFRKRVPLGEITAVEARKFHPLYECGGWGARYRKKTGWCYVMSGDRAVAIRYGEGMKMVVGSRRVDELAEVLTAAAGLEVPAG